MHTLWSVCSRPLNIHQIRLQEAAMAPTQEKARIVRKEQLSRDVFRFTAEAPQLAAAARPGQFVMIKTGSGFDPLLRRPFSVHQVTAGGQVQILFRVVGKGTRQLAAFASGQELDILGPFGRGFSVATAGPVCLVGGGMGLAPLFFLAKHLLQMKRSTDEIAVLLGAASRDELAVLAGNFQTMGLNVKLSTDDGSMGHRGLVTDLMAAMDSQTPWSVYACGPYPMLRAVAAGCAGNGWSCQVSLETMMACGFAACLGCAVPRADQAGYLHTCKDGPVFKAEELLWL